jgi:hypothetical protein
MTAARDRLPRKAGGGSIGKTPSVVVIGAGIVGCSLLLGSAAKLYRAEMLDLTRELDLKPPTARPTRRGGARRGG